MFDPYDSNSYNYSKPNVHNSLLDSIKLKELSVKIGKNNIQNDSDLIKNEYNLINYEPKIVANEPKIVANEPKIINNEPKIINNEPKIINNDFEIENTNRLSNWKYNKPKKVLSKLISELGDPTYIINKRNGLVRWDITKDNVGFVHLLKDEEIKNCIPIKQNEFFYTTITCYIPPNKVVDILKIPGSIFLDLLKNEITVRSDSIDGNYAILRTIIDHVDNIKSINSNYKNNIKKKPIKKIAI